MSESSRSIFNNTPTADAVTLVQSTLEVVKRKIFKSDFAHKLGVHVRDLRVVVQPPTDRVESAIFATESTVIFAVDGLQIVFSGGEPLVFSPESAIANLYIERLKAHCVNYRPSEFDRQNAYRPDQFLVESFEVALITVLENLQRILTAEAEDPFLVKTLSVPIAGHARMKELLKYSSLLSTKQRLKFLMKRAYSVSNALENMLENDTVLLHGILCPTNWARAHRSSVFGDADDYGSSQFPETASAIDDEAMRELIELEDLVNDFAVEAQRLASQTESILDGIANKEAEARIQLDLLRNNFMRYSMVITIASFITALATLTTGIFGMNLKFPHYLQDNLAPFRSTVTAIAIIVPLFSFLLAYVGRKFKWLP